MNRLILIGNGFDLAHNLRTNYEHFLIDYFKKIVIYSLSKFDSFKDEFETECFSHSSINEEYVNVIFNKVTTISELMEHPDIGIYRYGASWNEQTALNKYPIVIRLQSRFFNGLVENKNWTDIESYYFHVLIKEFNNNPKVDPGVVNGPFHILSKKIFDHIEHENKNSRQFADSKFQDFINGLFKEFDSDKNEMLFVNFNFTDVLTYYTKFSHQEDHHVINIHGKISDRESLIFGYGDDSHKRYNDLEDSLNDDFLINIKSHKYNSDDTYDTLTKFIENGEFEVYVIGHSLGVSDRVLMKTIFENAYCKKIRLYHRGTKESHFKKRISLSRHFTDKIALRKKIVSFDPNHKFI